MDERNAQVMMMRKIYNFARHAIIYLGEYVIFFPRAEASSSLLESSIDYMDDRV